LVLPVATLVLVYMTLIIKNTRSTVEEMLRSDFVDHARALGLPRSMQLRYALHNALPPVVTVIGIVFWFLLGGAVLVETVFAWGRPSLTIGLIIVCVPLFLAFFGPAVAPYDPERALPGEGLQPPSLAHWMGTDVSGMDIFSRAISAPRIDLLIALFSSLIAF